MSENRTPSASPDAYRTAAASAEPAPPAYRGAVIHRLKTWREPFSLVWSKRKSFEIRRNDRDFREQDFLVLDQWDELAGVYVRDSKPLVRLVTCVVAGWGLHDGFVALGIDALAEPVAERTILAVAPRRSAS